MRIKSALVPDGAPHGGGSGFRAVFGALRELDHLLCASCPFEHNRQAFQRLGTVVVVVPERKLSGLTPPRFVDEVDG